MRTHLLDSFSVLGLVTIHIISLSFLRLIVSSCIAEFDLLKFICTTLIEWLACNSCDLPRQVAAPSVSRGACHIFCTFFIVAITRNDRE